MFILKKDSQGSTRINVECYLIGGFVRDKIIGRPTKDADIVCLGDGIALAHKVAERFKPKPHVAYFKNFGTAQIKIPGFFSNIMEMPLFHDHEEEPVLIDIKQMNLLLKLNLWVHAKKVINAIAENQ